MSSVDARSVRRVAGDSREGMGGTLHPEYWRRVDVIRVEVDLFLTLSLARDRSSLLSCMTSLLSILCLMIQGNEKV